MTRPKAPETRRGHPKRGQLHAVAGAAALATTSPPPAPAGAAPRAPRGLGPVGRDAWRRLWRAAGAAWQPVTDSDIVEMYCDMLDRCRMFHEVLDREGWVLYGAAGQPYGHPAARLLLAVEKQLVALEDRLGLNPESRLRLGLSQARVASELDRFMGPDG